MKSIKSTMTGGGIAPRVICSDSDGQNRQFIYTLYADGSAMSQEITRHLNYAGSVRETYRERYAVGSEMAGLINRLASQSPLPVGWYNA